MQAYLPLKREAIRRRYNYFKRTQCYLTMAWSRAALLVSWVGIFTVNVCSLCTLFFSEAQYLLSSQYYSSISRFSGAPPPRVNGPPTLNPIATTRAALSFLYLLSELFCKDAELATALWQTNSNSSSTCRPLQTNTLNSALDSWHSNKAR